MHLPAIVLYCCDLEDRKGTIRVNRELSVIHALMDLLCSHPYFPLPYPHPIQTCTHWHLVLPFLCPWLLLIFKTTLCFDMLKLFNKVQHIFLLSWIFNANILTFHHLPYPDPIQKCTDWHLVFTAISMSLNTVDIQDYSLIWYVKAFKWGATHSCS